MDAESDDELDALSEMYDPDNKGRGTPLHIAEGLVVQCSLMLKHFVVGLYYFGNAFPGPPCAKVINTSVHLILLESLWPL